MAFKNDESVRRLLENTADDEPIFIIVGRDVLSEATVAGWCGHAHYHNGTAGLSTPRVPDDKILEAQACAFQMGRYPPKKVPE